MYDINTLFFELIQVTLGVRGCLSHSPAAEEWKVLYDMAKKQSLIGICFAGVQNLTINHPSFIIHLNELLRLQWMGMAAKIQQRNEVVNRQCVELQVKLVDDGLCSCVLKGQGVASLYSKHLRGLRQSGDIDVLMWKAGLTQKENREKVVRYAKSIDCNAHDAEHHIAVEMFPNTEVEMHFCPSYLCNPFANKRMQKWFFDYDKSRFVETKLSFCMPDAEYNLVFMLSHTFRHYMSEGVGLRQLMDYYFVLRQFQEVSKLDKKACGEKTDLTKNGKTTSVSAVFHNEPLANDCSSEIGSALPSSANHASATLSGTADTSAKNNKNLLETLDSFNMLKFASAVMWVMKEVFGMEEQALICEPNERLGWKLLARVMQGGNFGHHNTKTMVSRTSHMGRFVNQLVQDLKLAIDYPAEALWAPISMIREFVRIRI